MRKGKGFRSFTMDGHVVDDGEYDIPENYEDIKKLLLTLIGQTNRLVDTLINSKDYCRYVICLSKELEMLCAVEEHIVPSPIPYR